MGRFRFSTRGLIVAVAIIGFDVAVMIRAMRQARAGHAGIEIVTGFGLVLMCLNLIGLGLWRDFARKPPGKRLVATPSPLVMVGLYLAMLSLAILSVLFFSSGLF